MGEFDLIERFFKNPALSSYTSPEVELGIGDDCALLNLEADQQLAVSTDLLLEGRHFFSDVDAYSLGHKALAVNLSDLAAMGAQPLAFTLALSLPQVNEDWLAQFSKGLLELANLHDCPLVGGDTTAGPLSIGITVMGKVPKNKALRRSTASLGDDIYVSGNLGWARLGLHFLQNRLAHSLSESDRHLALKALHWPQPRLALGQELLRYASAALDLSDGLSGDLRHLLKASGVGAVLFEDQLAACLGHLDYWQHFQRKEQADWALAGGDDYELCFTAAPKYRSSLEEWVKQHPEQGRLHRIGRITAAARLEMVSSEDDNQHGLEIASTGFDHFR